MPDRGDALMVANLATAVGGEFPHQCADPGKMHFATKAKVSGKTSTATRLWRHLVRNFRTTLPPCRQGGYPHAELSSLTSLSKAGITYLAEGAFAMKKMSEFDAVIGATTRDLSNWLARLELRTSYAPTVAGSARKFSIENVLELALINAFVRAGAMPQVAVAMADTHVRNFRSGTAVREWAVFAAGNYKSGRMADSLDAISFDALTTEQPDHAPVFSVVRVGEIVRRVEKLFSE